MQLLRNVRIALVMLVGLAGTHGVVLAQTNNSYPMLMSLKPTAAQIGQSTEHELNARYNLAGATQVIVAGAGVVADILPNEQEKPEDKSRNDVMGSKAKIRFTVAADAIPGVRDFRVITPHGASTVGQLVVGRDPVIHETPENDVIAKAQEIALPANICGTIEKGEDVDYFKFRVEAGTKLVFHMRSQRLQNRMHDMQIRIDPMVTIRTDNGSIVASCDNYYAGDPMLSHLFERAGEYYLEIRDVRYQGNVDWTYSVEINSRPFVTQAYPLAVPVGQMANLTFVGEAFDMQAPSNSIPFTASKSGVVWAATQIAGQATNEFAVVATNDPIVIEMPVATDGAALATDGSTKPTDVKPQLFSIPSVVTGRIAKPGEVDRFMFEAKAQEKFSFEVVARRASSGMDPKIRILNEAGSPMAESDDGTFDRVVSADSWLENWTAPADGKYQLEVNDLHQRGGPAFVYAVKAERAKPYFLLEADTDKTLLSPGMNSVVYVRGIRKNGFSGDIQLNVSGLPAGVSATCGRIVPGATDGCIVLQAAPDAAFGAVNVVITGKGTLPEENGVTTQLESTAMVLQEYYSPGGGRGNYPVEIHTISVEPPMDVRKITLSTDQIELQPGGSQRIDVTVERAPDYKGNVTLDVILQHLEQPYGNSLPPGVTVDVPSSKTLLTGSESTGYITLKAAANAAKIEKQLIPLNVHVSINFVMKHTFCGPPVFVSIK